MQHIICIYMYYIHYFIKLNQGHFEGGAIFLGEVGWGRYNSPGPVDLEQTLAAA